MKPLIGHGAFLYAAFALALLLSGVHPDPRVWGVHAFAFLPGAAWLTAACVLAVLLVPAVARSVGAAAAWVGGLLSRSVVVPIGLALAAGTLFFAARLDFQFLGDGMIWVGTLKEGKSFHHFEPLAAALTRLLATLLAPEHPETAAGALSILAGPIYVAATAFLCRALWADALARGVAWLLLLLHPLLLLFFGYVESYPLLLVLEVLYVLALAGVANGRIPLVAPALVLGLATAAHLTALAWAPALVVLAWVRCAERSGSRQPQDLRRGRPGARRVALLHGLVAMALALVVAATTSGAVGSSPARLLRDVLGQPGLGGQSLVWLVSTRHLLDLVNEFVLLLGPACILLGGTLSAARAPEVPQPRSFWGAMAMLLVGVLVVACFVEPRIGGARDWDLFLPLALPAVLLAVRAWRAAVPHLRGASVGPAAAKPGSATRGPQASRSPTATKTSAGGASAGSILGLGDAGRALGFAGVALLGWLAVGLDAGRSARRLEVLQEPRGTFSNFARGYANETLGIYYRERDRDAARQAWLRAAQANPSNPRYFNNLGMDELRRGNTDAACVAFRRTLELGMDEYFVRYNVANCDRQAGRHDVAEEHYDQLITRWPERWEAYVARGWVRVKLDRPAAALPDLQIAARLAPGEADVFYTMGFALEVLGRIQEARSAWQRTLQLDPAHAAAREHLQALDANAPGSPGQTP